MKKFDTATSFSQWCASSAFTCEWSGDKDHVGNFVRLTMVQRGGANVAAAFTYDKAVPVAGFAVLSDPRKYSRRSISSIDFPVHTFRLAITGQHDEINVELLTALKEVTTLKNIYRLLVTFHDSNIGCAGGWNRVLQADSAAPWYLVMNNDIAFPAGVLGRIHKNLHQHVTADPVANGFAVFGLPDLALYSTFAMSQKVVEKVGLFDENFWPVFFEDNDYTGRLHCEGIKAIQFDDCPLLHNEALGKTGEYVSGTRLLDKHGPDIQFAMNTGSVMISRKWGGVIGCRVTGDCKPPSCHPFNDASKSARDWSFNAQYRQCLVAGKGGCNF